MVEQPYQDDDFADDTANGKKNGLFKGPIYSVYYPPIGLNGDLEMMAWEKIGFQVKMGFSYDLSKGFTLDVLGEIPEWFQQKLIAAGARVEQKKARGEFVQI